MNYVIHWQTLKGSLNKSKTVWTNYTYVTTERDNSKMSKLSHQLYKN